MIPTSRGTGGDRLIRLESVRHSKDPREWILFLIAYDTVFYGVVTNVFEMIRKIPLAADKMIAEGFLPTKCRDLSLLWELRDEPLMEVDENVCPLQVMIYIITCRP